MASTDNRGKYTVGDKVRLNFAHYKDQNYRGTITGFKSESQAILDWEGAAFERFGSVGINTAHVNNLELVERAWKPKFTVDEVAFLGSDGGGGPVIIDSVPGVKGGRYSVFSYPDGLRAFPFEGALTKDSTSKWSRADIPEHHEGESAFHKGDRVIRPDGKTGEVEDVLISYVVKWDDGRAWEPEKENLLRAEPVELTAEEKLIAIEDLIPSSGYVKVEDLRKILGDA